jgi:predicted HicB family RNase H-like nuclease
MSKKSFTDANPAMAFISTAKEQEDFALSQPTKEDLEAKESSHSVPMKKNPEFIETKSKRVQMLMQPSLYDAVKKEAKAKNISVNEMMHEILKNHVEGH